MSFKQNYINIEGEVIFELKLHVRINKNKSNIGTIIRS